jgi:hypothetical protein
VGSATCNPGNKLQLRFALRSLPLAVEDSTAAENTYTDGELGRSSQDVPWMAGSCTLTNRCSLFYFIGSSFAKPTIASHVSLVPGPRVLGPWMLCVLDCVCCVAVFVSSFWI